MMRRRQQIFVLDIADQPAFAFEAENARAAALLVQTPRFARAFDDFCAKRGKAWTETAVVSTRAATDAEAALYRDRVAGFADATDQILVAHSPGDR